MKNESIYMRVTEEEKKEIIEKAAKKGFEGNISMFIRWMWKTFKNKI